MTIVSDPLFDQATIIGKVFEDLDRDGAPGPGERGVAQARVALDDGSYAVTDEQGRYHFPAVRPGQRMLKLDLASVPGARVTTEVSRIVLVTPGLMVRANFGIERAIESESIGAPPVAGLVVDSRDEVLPVEVVGNAAAMAVLVNGQPAPIDPVDVEIGREEVDRAAVVRSGKLERPVRFAPRIPSGDAVSWWHLDHRGRPRGAGPELRGERSGSRDRHLGRLAGRRRHDLRGRDLPLPHRGRVRRRHPGRKPGAIVRHRPDVAHRGAAHRGGVRRRQGGAQRARREGARRGGGADARRREPRR